MNSGDSLGPYEIKDPLGAGGMGEVYRAHDPRLERDVAIKVLPEVLADDPERLARFEREAKLLAQLNHANIASIYGLEQDGDTRFIAMELVEGETLADRMEASRPSSMPLDQVLDIATQITAALDTAHQSGVVHRDLKPANIMITPAGEVKVLDFGLAKAYEPDSDAGSVSPDISNSPTMLGATRTGVIMGTAAYMSPEQAAGQVVDKRTDIWAFGVILFEMLSGERMFTGETASHVLADVLRAEPDFDKLPADTPVPLRRLLRRCLEKKPGARLRDVGDASIELTDVREGKVDALPGVNAGQRADTESSASKWLPWAVAAAAVLAAVAAFNGTGSTIDELPARSLEIVIGEADGPPGFIQLSPDGSQVAYWAGGADRRAVFVQDIATGESRSVYEPENLSSWGPLTWSPDGSEIAHVSDFVQGGVEVRRLVAFPADGGRHRFILETDQQLFFPHWGGDDSIYVVTDEGLEAYDPTTNSGRVLLAHPGASLGDAASDWRSREGVGTVLSLGESDFLYTARAEGAISMHRWRNGETTLVRELEMFSNFPRLMLAGDGYLLADGGFSDAGLWAIPFDAETSSSEGGAFLLFEGGVGATASGDGTLIVRSFGERRVGRHEIVSVNRDNGEVTVIVPEGEYRTARMELEPGGEVLAAGVQTPRKTDVWLYPVSGGAPVLLEASDDYPIGNPVGWFFSGEALAVFREDESFFRTELSIESPSGEVQRDVLKNIDDVAMSPDGRYLVATIGIDKATVYELSTDRTLGPGSPFLPSRRIRASTIAISPDSRWVAFSEYDPATQITNLWIAAFPSGGSVRRVASSARSPRWSAVGDELFFVSESQVREGRSQVLVSMSLDPDTGEVRSPRELFSLSEAGGERGPLLPFGYTVSPDGQTFYMSRQIEPRFTDDEDRNRFSYLQNWPALFNVDGR